jgi:hypothetical protein
MMTWKLLALVLGAVTGGLSVLAVWQLIDRARLRRRFAGILDIDRETAARRRALHFGMAESQRAFDVELTARRRENDAELAKQVVELALARRNATQELADTMRKTSEMRARYASAKVVYDRLRARLSVLEQQRDDGKVLQELGRARN